jgi:hypothetical protein
MSSTQYKNISNIKAKQGELIPECHHVHMEWCPWRGELKNYTTTTSCPGHSPAVRHVRPAAARTQHHSHITVILRLSQKWGKKQLKKRLKNNSQKVCDFFGKKKVCKKSGNRQTDRHNKGEIES